MECSQISNLEMKLINRDYGPGSQTSHPSQRYGQHPHIDADMRSSEAGRNLMKRLEHLQDQEGGASVEVAIEGGNRRDISGVSRVASAWILVLRTT